MTVTESCSLGSWPKRTGLKSSQKVGSSTVSMAAQHTDAWWVQLASAMSLHVAEGAARTDVTLSAYRQDLGHILDVRAPPPDLDLHACLTCELGRPGALPLRS